MQTTSHILMIRPAAFGYNAETAVNNAFQRKSAATDVNEKAQKEFDDFVAILRSHAIDIIVVQDTIDPYTPDAIFPNNWASYHKDGTVIVYPMFAANRREERNKKVIEKIEAYFLIKKIIDLTKYENDNRFLEGTGSMILDRNHKIAYACISPRTNAAVLNDFCAQMGYRPLLFSATDKNGQDIYHTNVMMCVADKYVVICLQSIGNERKKKSLIENLKRTEKAIIEISFEQMNHFAGNMLQLQNIYGEKFLVMSSQAYQSLTQEQKNKIESFNPVIHAPLCTIEENGGGSARCMMAEIFLPVKT